MRAVCNALVLVVISVFIMGGIIKKNLFLFLVATLYFIFWFAICGGDLNREFTAMGAISSIVAFVVVKNFQLSTFELKDILLLKYFGRLFIEIFKSSIFVIKFCIKKSSSDKLAGVSWVDFSNSSFDTKNIVMQANSITMTPGTVVVQIDKEGKKILVHAIDTSLIDELPNNLAD